MFQASGEAQAAQNLQQAGQVRHQHHHHQKHPLDHHRKHPIENHRKYQHHQ